MSRYGFYRVSVCSPVVSIGNPEKNAKEILKMTDAVPHSPVVVFPELCVSGYTCGDLFRQHTLLEQIQRSVYDIKNTIPTRGQLVFIGAPVPVGSELFNCAIALFERQIIGIVPKTNIPNYAEFYESRWFRAADGNEPKTIKYGGQDIPFGTDLIFRYNDLLVYPEICEDLWMPIPPSSYAAIAGANLIVNLSASNETVGKNEYRIELIKNQSARCVAGYAYSSAGPSESTTDVVFGGHCVIAENGTTLAETPRVGHPSDPVGLGGWHASTEIDVQKLMTERRLLTSFGDSARSISKTYRTVYCWDRRNSREPVVNYIDPHGATMGQNHKLIRPVNGTPFIPKDPTKLRNRCAEIFGIQCTGLYKRLEQINFGDVYIGVSGGLDSTLALLVTVKAYQKAGIDLTRIHGLTMPGFGTTSKTANNAIQLMDHMGISRETIDIREMCMATFKAINHSPFGIPLGGLSQNVFEEMLRDVPKEKRVDLVFENVQARERTKVLMSKGFVIGTGDMSELALGWCTYNGDHMSMYNVNGSVPKTLVKFLVKYYAETEASDNLKEVLLSIVDTIISPELLPASNSGEIEQSSEDVLGPYELHDFFLANFIRSGFSPDKLYFLATQAEFENNYTTKIIDKTLKIFVDRFFKSQFKRSCVPDGPKVGSVSLSPRGDWRMPSDADPSLWME